MHPARISWKSLARNLRARTPWAARRLQVEAKWVLKDSSNNSLVTKSETEAEVMSQTDTYRFPWA